MKNKTARISAFLLIVVMLLGIVPVAFVASASGVQTVASASSGITTTPGASENLSYFKEDTSYDMTNKTAPMTFEFELTGTTHIAGAAKGGVIIGNYSENASTYINVEASDYGKIIVRGKFNGGSEWTATFYQSEADIRVGGVTHYTVVVASGWTGVSLYVNGNLKATRYPASLTLPKASDYTHPFRIGGDYSSDNTNYFKGLINSVAMYNDIRSASEIKSDMARTKSWSNSDGLIAAYDLTKMGVAALRDYSGNGNTLVYNNGSGIQVENFGKYEIDKNIESNIETFEAWIFMPDYYHGKIGGTIVGNYRSYNGARILLEVYADGNPRLSYTNAEGKTSYHRFTNVDLRTGAWQHLTVVHDAKTGEARCYVNGELKQTLTENVLAYSDNALEQKFLIGRDTALRYAEGDGEYWENRKDQYFKGFIKELRLYSDVRSAEEIAADYAGALDTADAGLLACYQISPENKYDTLTDVSGNGYDAAYKQLLWEAEYVEPIENNYAYSLALVGDTQTVNDQNPELLKSIYQWIVDNKDAKNIQYVIGLGDITEYGVDVGHTNYQEERANKQWTAAKEAISIMDGELPYSLIRGDGHDGIEMFNKYFANHEGYTQNISGYYEEGRIDNVYHTFKIGEVDYMLLCLDHGTKDDVLVWANEVVAAHPNHRVIVTTHQYMRSDGTLSSLGTGGNATAYDPNNNAADGLWDKFLSKHPNICMVMCGHSDVDGVKVTKQTADHGNEVTQILVNPQTMDAEYYQGSKGMVAMLYFSADGQNVQVEYYSTIKGTYYPCDDFTVSYSEDTHTYNTVVTAPTCTDGGCTTYTCSVCEYGYTADFTLALGHTEIELEAKEPTCTDTGLTVGKKCSACDTVFVEQSEISALGHSYNAVVTAPTCESAGFTTYTCSTCGDSYVSDETESLGHNYVVTETLTPTCTENGLKTYTCQNDAAHSYTEELSALGHNYDSVVTAPTCTEAGCTTYTCSVCGDNYVADEVAALGHNSDAVVTAPDCLNGGYTTYTCSVCGDSYVADEVAALGHNYNAAVTAPTCTEAGYTTYTCSVCGDSYVADEVAALGHNYNAAVTAPTCTEAGCTAYTCSVCGDSYVADEVAALGHNYDAAVTAPTCTEGGYTTYTCSACFDNYVADIVGALGHTDVEPKDYICDTCEEDLCTEHNAELIPAVAPTCTVAGLSEGEKCSICGEILVAQTTVSALGHSYDAVVTAPTCTDAGFTTYTCHCGDSYVADETEALGHTEKTLEGKDATCTENGLTDGKACSVCGETLLAQEEILADGHTYEVEIIEPTCTEGGYTTYTCHCGDTYTDFVTEATGHDWAEATTEAPKTCKNCGKTEGDKLPEETTPDEEPDEELGTEPDTNPDDEPDTEPSEDKNHAECEPKDELQRIITLIINFIRSLFGLPEQCYCGEELN